MLKCPSEDSYISCFKLKEILSNRLVFAFFDEFLPRWLDRIVVILVLPMQDKSKNQMINSRLQRIVCKVLSNRLRNYLVDFIAYIQRLLIIVLRSISI